MVSPSWGCIMWVCLRGWAPEWGCPVSDPAIWVWPWTSLNLPNHRFPYWWSRVMIVPPHRDAVRSHNPRGSLRLRDTCEFSVNENTDFELWFLSVMSETAACKQLSWWGLSCSLGGEKLTAAGPRLRWPAAPGPLFPAQLGGCGGMGIWGSQTGLHF